MTFRLNLSLVTILVALVGFGPIEAAAQCEDDDYACKKFSRADKARKAAVRRAKLKRQRRAARRQETAPATSAITTSALPATPTPALTLLKPGAMTEAPGDLSKLVFRSGDQFEQVAAKCQPLAGSTQRISCAIAVHRTAMTSEAGAGCTGSLDLREMVFARTADGGWSNEDSIALCGGRLLRRTTMIAVAVDGTPQYALKETYQMLGGDSACAAPYLRSRHPLRKSYMPASTQRRQHLQCGTVASR